MNLHENTIVKASDVLSFLHHETVMVEKLGKIFETHNRFYSNITFGDREFYSRTVKWEVEGVLSYFTAVENVNGRVNVMNLFSVETEKLCSPVMFSGLNAKSVFKVFIDNVEHKLMELGFFGDGHYRNEKLSEKVMLHSINNPAKSIVDILFESSAHAVLSCLFVENTGSQVVRERILESLNGMIEENFKYKRGENFHFDEGTYFFASSCHTVEECYEVLKDLATHSYRDTTVVENVDSDLYRLLGIMYAILERVEELQ